MNSLAVFKFKTVPVILGSFFLMLSCSEATPKKEIHALRFPDKPDPRESIFYRANSPVTIKMEFSNRENHWGDTPWTDYFVDIEGSLKPAPRLKTHAKMLWDDTNIYIAAELEEPHISGKTHTKKKCGVF